MVVAADLLATTITITFLIYKKENISLFLGTGKGHVVIRMRNILVITGGGRRNGNTAQLVDAFVHGAEDAGHHVERISLMETEIKGCIGCNACRHGSSCVQKDGFTELIPQIEKADLLVFASPLYYWTISARLKAFIERFYCIAEEDPAPPFGRYEKYPEKD